MRRVNIDTQLLRSFVAVAETGGFGQAAESLNMTQPAMSQQMRRLEELIGRALFQRDGRKLVFTGHGELLLGYARRILELNDDVHRRLSGDDEREIVRLGMPEHFSESLLPLVISAVHERYPDVQLVVKVARSQTLSDLVAGGRLDLALTLSERDPGAHARPLHVAPVTWFGATGADLPRLGAEVPLVLFRAPCGIRQLAISALERAEIPWRCVHESEELAALRAAVSVNLGVTALPDLQIFSGLSALDAPRDADRGLPPLPDVAVVLEKHASWDSRTAPGLEALVTDVWNAFRAAPRALPSVPMQPQVARAGFAATS